MTPEFIASFFLQGFITAIKLAGPILIAGLVAGVLVSMFQTATSINEMTLVFIPKMLAVGLALLLLFPWMLDVIVTYTHMIFTNIPAYVK